MADKPGKGKDPGSPRTPDVPASTQAKELGKARKKITSPSLGQTWFVVSAKWYELLNKFLASAGSDATAPSPGPIANGELIHEASPKDSPQLKQGLQDTADYVLVNEHEWTLLFNWYACLLDALC
jgi:hypothetical protein